MGYKYEPGDTLQVLYRTDKSKRAEDGWVDFWVLWSDEQAFHAKARCPVSPWNGKHYQFRIVRTYTEPGLEPLRVVYTG